MKESVIQKAILDFLKAKGICAWKNHTQGVRLAGKGRTPTTTPGRPDIEGILPDGTYLAIEVKAPKGKRSKEQKDWIDKARQLKACAFFAECVDDVDFQLKQREESA